MIGRRFDIPFNRDGAGRFLPWLIALMVYLAALATSGALVLDRALGNWDRGLSGALTVELPPAAGKSGDGGLAAAIATLQATSGVTSARALSRDEVAKLLEPWLGPNLRPEDIALPRLVDVRVDIVHGVDLTALTQRLVAAAPDAVLDDHRLWLDRLAAIIHMAEAMATGIVVLIGAAAVLTVIFTTRTGLAVHRDVIELLHLMGAQDAYIADQFEHQALRLGIAGGVIGLALAVATLVALGRAGDAVAMLGGQALPGPSLELAPWHWASLVVLPAAAAGLAMLTARLTVLGALARMP